MKKLLPFLFCTIMLVLGACGEEPEPTPTPTPDPVLTVSPQSLAFTAEGGAQNVQVKANNAWTASASGSGISVSPTSGEGDATVTVTAAATNSTDQITGTVSFSSKGLSASVSVVQEERKVLKVGEGLDIPAEGGTFAVDIQYNTDYDVVVESAAKSWITFVATRALQSGKLEFQFAENPDTDARQGRVTIKDKSGKAADQTLTFVQAEKKVIQAGDGSAIDIPAEGGTFQVDIKYNTDYTVEVASDAPWITFITTRSLTSGKLEFQFAENPDTDARQGRVTIKDKSGKAADQTLTFVQAEKKVIAVGDVMTIPAGGGTFEVDVQYNTDVVVEVESAAQSWITFVAVRALTSGKLEFNFEANEGPQRTGKVTIRSIINNIAPIELIFTQLQDEKLSTAQRVMTDIYEALGARNWNEPWIPGVTWPGFSYDREKGAASIVISNMGAKGTIPESLGDLGDILVSIFIQNEPGISGTIPDSFRKLVNLKDIYIRNTSMTSLPDLFGEMKELETIAILYNSKMTGSLPESLHNCAKLQQVHFGSNMFTGNVPASWSKLSEFCFVFENCLSGKLSVFCHTPAEIKSFVANGNLWQRDGYGFDISDVEIPRHSLQPEGSINDLDGNPFTFEDVISRNKYTVYLIWDTWSPYSLSMMQELKEYYEEYHKDGLEIIATVMLGPNGPWNDLEEQKRVVDDNGYDLWYNFYWQAVSSSFLSHTPAAEVYDSKGNILFSGFTKYLDPVRNRFTRSASEDLVPFLETLFGPMHPYTSTDYSKDGEVKVLQSASVGKGVNIVFMGDAYTDKDMADGGRYDMTMREAMEEFFAIEPYKTFRNRFNVYEVKVVSPNGKIGNRYSTAMSCYYGGGTTILGDHDKCFEYALKVPGIVNQDNLLINVMVNSERNIGTTFMSYMRQSCVSFTTTANDNRQDYGPVLRHEGGGHGIAFLADEYANYSGTPPTDHVSTYNSRFEDYGWYSNIDFTNDRTKIRWKAFLSDSRYNGQVGIFEGAALYEKGAFRPSEKSIMRYMDESDEFNAPSRWAIYQQIMKRSGEEPSFEKFLEYDAVNRASASSVSTVRPPLKAAEKGNSVRLFEQGAPPVIVR